MKTASIFSDNMVLQRNKPVRFFGTCSDDETITVSAQGKTAFAVVSDGKWEAVLPPLEVCTDCTVTISSGNETITFKNVAVGEVWLAGGQSNMEFELHNDINGQEALENCSDENVRFYYTPKIAELKDVPYAESYTIWNLPSAEKSRAWSAVGYYFAKELSRKLGVTVGVIGCNWGGTSASAWVDREALSHDDRIRIYIDEYDKACEGKTPEQMRAEYQEYSIYQEAWNERIQKCFKDFPGIKWEDVVAKCGENRFPGPAGISNPMRPCGLYKTMISRLFPYTLAGILYYQGESDDHRPDTYEILLKSLIKNWRTDWKDQQLPFLMVQLPMFRYESEPENRSWAKIRQAQMNTYKTVRNTGIAVALDCGEFNNIHPTDKSQIAHRLYLSAMNEVYGGISREEALPPLFSHAIREKGGIRLYFDNCSGFELKGELIGFEVFNGKEFVPAEAFIDGEQIFIKGENIFAGRFQFINYNEVTLFGRNGIPVPPFSWDFFRETPFQRL